MELVVATNNPHKLEEIGAILNAPSLLLLPLSRFPEAAAPEEDGETFESNARKKAVSAAIATGRWALADDSGLEVAALGGRPGVHSARYAGEPADYAANNLKLLRELSDVADRSARFRCVLALADPAGAARTVEGACGGSIIREPRGKGGFGYDPLFVPDGYAETFAEMPAVLKNKLSHRYRALVRAQEEWSALLAGHPSPPQSALLKPPFR